MKDKKEVLLQKLEVLNFIKENKLFFAAPFINQQAYASWLSKEENIRVGSKLSKSLSAIIIRANKDDDEILSNSRKKKPKKKLAKVADFEAALVGLDLDPCLLLGDDSKLSHLLDKRHDFRLGMLEILHNKNYVEFIAKWNAEHKNKIQEFNYRLQQFETLMPALNALKKVEFRANHLTSKGFERDNLKINRALNQYRQELYALSPLNGEKSRVNRYELSKKLTQMILRILPIAEKHRHLEQTLVNLLITALDIYHSGHGKIFVPSAVYEMKGVEHIEVATKDRRDSDGKIILQAIYDPEQLPEGITLNMLEEKGYHRLSCEFNQEQKEFLVDVLKRKFIVVEGIPFYCSSGTSNDQSVISPAWRKNVWMPCMGLEVQGRPGRIAKLGDRCSAFFSKFVTKLVDNWAKTISDDELKALYLPRNRKGYIRWVALRQLTEQIERFGSLKAFAISMELLPDEVWQAKEEGGENFSALRSLHDFYRSNYSDTDILSEETLAKIHSVSFETFNENYHVVKLDEDNRYHFDDSSEVIRQETQKRAYQTNSKLINFGADVARLAQLNNPDAKLTNTLAHQLGFLIVQLYNFRTAKEAQTFWDHSIEQIVKNLLVLEQEIDIKEQQLQYKALFKPMFSLIQELKKCKTLGDMSKKITTKLIESGLFSDDTITNLHELILNSVNAIYESSATQLQTLVKEYLRNVKTENPVYPVLTQLNQDLTNPDSASKAKVDSFFVYLTENDGANFKILKADNSRNWVKFWGGVAIIAAIVFTGVLPGVFISAGVYCATGYSVFGLFKTCQEEFFEKVPPRASMGVIST